MPTLNARSWGATRAAKSASSVATLPTEGAVAHVHRREEAGLGVDGDDGVEGPEGLGVVQRPRRCRLKHGGRGDVGRGVLPVEEAAAAEAATVEGQGPVPAPFPEDPMAYSQKFQALGEAARVRVEGVAVDDLPTLVAQGAVLLDIDKEEHDAGTMPGAVHLSRGKLEMNIETVVPDATKTILCFCNANHRGSLSAAALKDMGYDARVIVGGLNAWKARVV